MTGIDWEMNAISEEMAVEEWELWGLVFWEPMGWG